MSSSVNDSQNVRVIVRVRPFNEREKQLISPCIVKMEGNSTHLINCDKPHDEPRKFTFDHSYWSHDGFNTTASGYSQPANSKYVDQLKVYQDIGAPMLEAAWSGYNCSLFAYGQTGSGKSYTVMGYGANPGLVPNICTNLFQQIASRRQPNVEYKVTFSMLEIYNEEVRDLLATHVRTIGGKKPSLQVRERKDKGFYADGLTIRPVSDYEAIKASLAEGDKNRTLAATKMNETSSRAHTIVTINFHQSKPNNITVLSAINLVDLAGSERQSQTQATGERFRESTNINKSLSTLGNVLKALVDRQKGKNVSVPYRDSKLTMLLKNALEGNSKTTMIATLSPAEDNYEQTLSTLKYADRAKAIRTHAVVNETATDKLIKELMSEKEKLLLELEQYRKGMKAGKGMSEEEVDEIKASYENEIERYKQEMSDLTKTWEQRLTEEREASKQRIDELEAEEQQKKTMPFLWNLNEDPSLCNKISHFIEGSKAVGNRKSNPPADIILSGPSIHTQHAVVKLSDGRISIIPKHGKVYVNGDDVTSKKRLHHNDRICFGSHAIFVVSDPKKSKSNKSEEITYEFAQKELARQLVPEIEEEDELLKQEVLSVMPEVRDANAISEEFGKQCVFEIVLVSALARGKMEGRTEAFVKMTSQTSGVKYMWDKDKFLKRQAVMMQLYQDFEDKGIDVFSTLEEVSNYMYLGGDQSSALVDGSNLCTLTKEDPFYEPYETDCLVGLAAVPLLSLAYLVTFSSTFPLLNYEAEQVGHVSVTLLPCDGQGRENESHLDNEEELVWKNAHFKIIIDEAQSIPNGFKETWCSYKFNNSNPYYSPAATGTNPKYSFSQMFSYPSVGHDLKLYLSQENLIVEIWGHQNISDKPSSASSNRLHAKREEIARLKAEVSMYKESLMQIGKIVAERKSCDCCEEIFEEVERELDIVLGV